MLLSLLCLMLAEWVSQPSGVTSSLRGLSAVSDRAAWASGTKGTVLRTTDGGATWTRRPVAGGESLDFRDVEAFSADHAILMSAGAGALSRIYETRDGGERWKLLLENQEPKGFFDSIAFWDARRGLILGDAVGGRMVVLRTEDGGASWKAAEIVPPANEGEGAFAASGTAVVVRPGGRAWFATGGVGGGRVYRSTDWGRSWRVSQTPVRHDNASSGVFSIAFQDDRRGIAVGGDYSKPDEDHDNIAFTIDGGHTWTASRGARPRGFRSAVIALENGGVMAAGSGGTDVSRDSGQTWESVGTRGYHTLSRTPGRVVWAAGSEGAIARYRGPSAPALVHRPKDASE